MWADIFSSPHDRVVLLNFFHSGYQSCSHNMRFPYQLNTIMEQILQQNRLAISLFASGKCVEACRLLRTAVEELSANLPCETQIVVEESQRDPCLQLVPCVSSEQQEDQGMYQEHEDKWGICNKALTLSEASSSSVDDMAVVLLYNLALMHHLTAYATASRRDKCYRETLKIYEVAHEAAKKTRNDIALCAIVNNMIHIHVYFGDLGESQYYVSCLYQYVYSEDTEEADIEEFLFNINLWDWRESMHASAA